MQELNVKNFMTKYESLNGIVHLVEDARAAVKVVASILNEAAVERLVLAELPGELSDALISRCREDRIDVLKPPFTNSEVPHLIDEVSAGISRAAFAIAETGTIVEFATNDAVRLISSLPNIHICIIKAEEIVERLMEASTPIREFYLRNPKNGVVTFISGPSRTGDIEMRLTLGVHGPGVSHVIVMM